VNDPEREPGAGPDLPPTLEGRLKRLEQILVALEADELELERALELFEEGVAHVRAAERVLSETELRVEELLDADGTMRVFEGEGEGGG
jgi:exodeoxyribonuclease VII small subunit